MGIIGDKLKEKIENNNNIRYSDTIAEITYYDNTKNTASIRFTNPNNGTIMIADNVAVKINVGGLSQAALTIGQKCWISFIGGNLLCPIITNTYDDRYYDNIYSKKTNSDQGAYIVNSNINDININSIEVQPMIDDYFNDSISTKYSLITKDYTNTEAIQEVRNMIMTINKYKPSEDGITNIKNNSTVKFKDNGDVDIFISNNTGIRIANKKIYFYSEELNFNGIDLMELVKANNQTTVNNNINNINNNESNEISFITEKDAISIIRIETIIGITNTTELEELIELLIQVNGTNSKLTDLKKDIEEYKTLKEQYLNYKINASDIQKTYNRIKYLSELFDTELKEASKIVIEGV